MASLIEDYALIGDTHSAALVARDGSIDWLCLPRIDSPACFAALLGDENAGRWRIAPTEPVLGVTRRYRGDTLVLETDMTTATGTVRITDAMLPRAGTHAVLRLVEGLAGRVRMRSEARFRFDYGSIVPWVRRRDEHTMTATAGPDAVTLRTTAPMEGRDSATFAEFEVAAGQSVPFSLTWYPSHQPTPPAPAVRQMIAQTEAWWNDWMAGCSYDGLYQAAVRRSLITLKALTFAPTGGIVAAVTTSLPEHIGGVRNWDYRYCWLRDATITLLALLDAGFTSEALAWREWLLRAVAGDPSRVQIMYGVAGERRLPEYEVPWLPGYENSAPVRVGNAAVDQFQLDVYGEVLDALHVARMATQVDGRDDSWPLQTKLMEFLETGWRKPDEGIWEVRGPRRHFTHSKVMAWVAADRAVKGIVESGLPGPVERWAALRDEVHREVCARGFDQERNTFTQFYGSSELDAALLYMPLVGFLPATDPRVVGTVAAIERELLEDGFVNRYPTAEDGAVDGLPAGEGAFLACTFWLADNYALSGRVREAQELFERLLALRNDVGLLAEEYDPRLGRMTGNFPQAFSHVPLVNTARTLTDALRGMPRSRTDRAYPPGHFFG
ncbi:glycoside hydrolase family 15 protein [Frankia sp. CNm7]|uniref:Trehalase n=1 Tax=Frankia nepalensis TaxID=1836974 RepID=A0A937RMV3_9ACTN|nr:glycoside hydrolase family 15 protein [Frankia nepalensis]MBL7496418.1 glycoside hydrolase family 15 protein [Frankia nepalensis]MBL7513788.1 glycoside hydrolase family 15 protein [Frankia nepalensis]MBL7524688.1 glycoside hydrolase family 15 protein [Frankia nepalensis]MBL7630204.1 glycoside hydrolase family 15 protein [Frankia nepalensis]